MADRIPFVVPPLGESVTRALLSRWVKQVGDAVQQDETVAELETDKVTLEIHAPADGVLESLAVQQGETVVTGQPLGYLLSRALEETPKTTNTSPTPAPPEMERLQPQPETAPPSQETSKAEGTLKGERLEKRVPLSSLRLRVAERLKQAQNTAAILTTFNEIDLSVVQDLRQKYREAFEKKHGVKLGLMSFFVMAVAKALQEMPILNAEMDQTHIIYKNYYDIGIALAGPHGLVVPVLRDADRLDLASIEKGISTFTDQATHNQLRVEDLTGGTFTISNGGVFGSLLSTPILNPPQVGILGLHKIQDRPVVVKSHIEIRPMMYVALSYDHRLIDGKDAVTFLVWIKDFLENPGEVLLGL